MYPYWHSSFRQRVLAARSPQQVQREAILASLEAIARAARRAKWSVRHTSQFKGRVNSRYITLPNGRICRVSNHPLTELQEARKYWQGEVIVGHDAWRSTTLPQWLRQIKRAVKP